ncbi:MAG: T9SS type A sorting domain-containing protein [Bacteroidales bacterium]|nr:T9SS type A sorting domain-containing protein [Bacteroidales bacterium]
MTLFFVVIFINMFGENITAQIISGVSSNNIADGENVVISGSGFGINSAIGTSNFQWLGNNIEDGTLDAIFSKTGWANKVNTPDLENTVPVYSATRSHSGSKSIKVDYSGTPYKGNFYWDAGSAIPSIYLTWWIYVDYDDASTGQWKIWRLTDDGAFEDCHPGFVQSCWNNGNGRMATLFQDSSLDSDWCTGSCAGWARCNPCPYPHNSRELYLGADDTPGPGAIEDRWVRMEYFIDMGTRGNTDGKFLYWFHDPESVTPTIHAVEELQFENIIMLKAEESTTYRYPIFGGFSGDGMDNLITYWDDMLVQVGTRSRVEIGDNPDWNYCTHREIQIPTAWSNNSITITANQGSFQDDDTAYLFVVDENGTVSNGYPITISTGSTGNIPPAGSDADNFILQQNNPNPFNTQTTISYQLPVKAHTTLKIYNIFGQEIRTLVNENQPAGEHSIIWNGTNASREPINSGIYFCILNINNKSVSTKKIVLLK